MFNRLKASGLVVGFMSLVLYTAYIMAQSGDFGGGGTNPIVSGGGSGDASTNAANQAWSGTNTFNGITTFNGKVTMNGPTNYIKCPLVIGTNITISGGYNLYMDGRSLGGFTQATDLPNGGALNDYRGDIANNKLEQETITGTTHTRYDVGMTAIEHVLYTTATKTTYANSVAAGNIRHRTTVSGFAVGPQGVAFTNIVSGTIVADPPSLIAGATFTTNIAVTGARAGSSPVFVGSDYITNGIVYMGYCITNGEIMVEFENRTLATTIDTASQTVRAVQTVVP